jgi:hypothetical protein
MHSYNSGPKRGQRMATNQRHQANALRKNKKRKTSASNQGGASIGGGASA